jgi:hypothetical protein
MFLILEGASEQGSGSTGKATGGFRAQFENRHQHQMSRLLRLIFSSIANSIAVTNPRVFCFSERMKTVAYLRRSVEKQKSLERQRRWKSLTGKRFRKFVRFNVADNHRRSFRRARRFYQSARVMNGFTIEAIENAARKSNLKRAFFNRNCCAEKSKPSKRTKAESNAKKSSICSARWRGN